jgi:hypothetical protein
VRRDIHPAFDDREPRGIGRVGQQLDVEAARAVADHGNDAGEEIAKGGALSFGRAELVQADDAHE